MSRRVVALLLLLSLVLLAPVARSQNAPVKVMVANPISREVTDFTDFTGFIEAGEEVAVHARISGEIVKVHVKAGDLVKKGDLLCEIDPRIAQAEIARAEAEVAKADAVVKYAAVSHTRLKALAASGAAKKEDLDSASAKLLKAEAELKIARADLQLARLKLEFTKVTAPLGGKIGAPTISVGSAVKQLETQLVTITQPNSIRVRFEIDERTALRLVRADATGKGIEIRTRVGLIDEIGWPHKGTVNLTNLRFKPTTNTAEVRITFTDPGVVFIPGLSCRVRLEEGKAYKALLVGRRAMKSDDDGVYVLVVNAKNIIERRGVKVGKRQGGLEVITDGLKAGDLVVVDAESGGFNNPFGGGRRSTLIGEVANADKIAMPETAPSTRDSPFGKSKGKGSSRP